MKDPTQKTKPKTTPLAHFQNSTCSVVSETFTSFTKPLWLVTAQNHQNL